MMRRMSTDSRLPSVWVSVILRALLLRQSSQCRDLAEIFLHLRRRDTEMALSRRNVRHDPGFLPEPSAGPDLQMTGLAALGHRDAKRAPLGRAGGSGLGHKNENPPQSNVVPVRKKVGEGK